MNQKSLLCFFVYSSGALLLATALAKIVSAFGTAQALQTADPIFAIQFRFLFLVVGAIELMAGLFCLMGKRLGLRLLLIAWLATSFVIYRLGLLWLGYHKPCGCLGTFTDALHISPQVADLALKIVLAYFLIGSYSSSIWLWLQNKSAISSVKSA